MLAAVSDTLPVSIILGRDVPELMALLGKEPTKETKQQTDPVYHDVCGSQYAGLGCSARLGGRAATGA